jgi:hypothetical protein
MVHASCLCGDISWEVDEPFLFLSHCHCSRCRKLHGTPFGTYLAVPAESLRLNGREGIGKWESSPGFFRTFCRACGSKVPGVPYGGMEFVPAGTLDGDPGIRPSTHIFVASKASWYEIADDLPRHEAYPDGFEAPALPDREPPDRPGNGVRGSCACQSVTFRIIEAPQTARICHCGRCRKARAAAFAANLIVGAGGVIFTRGHDHVVTFKVPSADRFTQAFCATCASPMPMTYRERGIAVVPMGALDDPPPVLPREHIFVGSKAPWFEIRDDLPQFETSPG